MTEVFLNLTEVFPCFFLSCKANARVKLAKTGHGPHSTTLVVFVLFCVLFVCKCVLPQSDNPVAVNKYINKRGVAECEIVIAQFNCIYVMKHQDLKPSAYFQASKLHT